MDCFAAPFVSFSHSFSLFFLSLSITTHTHCSMMSAGDLIEQIDCKWNQGVWVNQSNIVKQFFGHEGISLAYVELIRDHSTRCCLGFQGQGPRPLWLHGEPHTHPSACSIASECPTTLLFLCCTVQLEWWISKLNADLSIHGHSLSKFHSLDVSQTYFKMVSRFTRCPLILSERCLLALNMRTVQRLFPNMKALSILFLQDDFLYIFFLAFLTECWSHW